MTTGWRPVPGAALTAREAEVLRLVAEENSNNEIAVRLGISVHTVKRHVVRIGCKLDASTRAGMVRAGFEQGWLRLPERVLLRQASEVAARRMAAKRLAEVRAGRAA